MLDDINWKELALAWRRINKEAQKGYDGKKPSNVDNQILSKNNIIHRFRFKTKQHRFRRDAQWTEGLTVVQGFGGKGFSILFQ